jgi:hypothetical protein
MIKMNKFNRINRSLKKLQNISNSLSEKRPMNITKTPVNATKVFTNIAKKNVKNVKNSSGKNIDTSFILFIFILILVFLLLFFLFYYFIRNKDNYEMNNEIIQQSYQSPKGILDMPTQMGAPVSNEKGPDSSENAYLTLYGSPDAPGFKEYSQMGNNLKYSGYSSGNYYAEEYPQMGDYYLEAEYENIPRRNLNGYIQKQNRYVRSINNRIKQINEKRMYDPAFIRHLAELSELRNFERELANKVHKEADKQPILPDQSPYL